MEKQVVQEQKTQISNGVIGMIMWQEIIVQIQKQVGGQM